MCPSTSAAVSIYIKPEALKVLVMLNVRKAMDRLCVMAPVHQPAEDLLMALMNGQRNPIVQGAVALVEAAMDIRGLSRMEPTWHPWL